MPLLSSDATRWRPPRWVFALAAFAILLVSTVAQAGSWQPPPLRGHVVDEAGALAPDQARLLDRKLDRARRQTGFAIVVYLLPQLPEGLSIEDVGYKAINTWGVGSMGGDDGVLLIASLGDRKLRIETGKGVGGALTDIQSSHIDRDVIAPLMKEGRTYEAMNAGVDAILRELVANTPGGTSDQGRTRSAGRGAQVQPTATDFVKLGATVLAILVVIVLAIVSPTFREILFWVLLFGRFGGGGGRGGDGDSGYRGGGGRGGGGGSSDDY